MHRVQVSVSILLVLLVGILFVLAGAWGIHAGLGSSESGENDGGSVTCLGILLTTIGALLSVAAVCVAAWQKPWRHQ